MNKTLKKCLLMATTCTMLTGFTATTVTPPVQAAGAAESLLSGGLAMVYVSSAINKMDNTDQGQQESLENAKKQTGYYDNPAAQARVKGILANLEKSPLVKRKGYTVYVNPENDFNAFMTIGRVMSVNKGALDKLDDSELAYVMAHELSHGEHKDIVNGLKKQVGLATAVSAVDGGNNLLANIAGNYINNQVFTMSQEKNADKLGFQILADTDYNIGGAPAAMVVLRNAYGDHYREGLASVINPNNHPKTSSRVTTNNQYMYEYSGNHVSVSGETVYVNGVNIYTPAASGQYTGEERAYFMAGKLAKMYHKGQIYTGAASYSGPSVIVAGTSVITTPGADVASMVANNLNTAFAKPAPEAKNGKGASKSNGNTNAKKSASKAQTKKASTSHANHDVSRPVKLKV